MIAQYTAASLVSENKILAHPASVDSIPTSANQEDHVSMGTIAARKARDILKNVRYVIAIELLCASQGVEFHRPLKAGIGAQTAYKFIRKKVPRLEEDRVLHHDIEKIAALIEKGDVLRVVEKKIGNMR
jgi:histidine ammonia-lyase